jgi:multiple sugar transport system ATP-binding protein
MAQIRLNRIAKRFGDDSYAVQPTDLVIGDGEFLSLLGPSGCGKTTTLRMIAGLENPTEGEILFDDTRVDLLPPGKRNVAMVFQNYALYPHLTVRGNLEYPLRKRGVAKAERDQKVSRTAETLHISELLDRRPRQLSGGQQQRVALGRALIRDPQAFLFDEPLSNLDAQLRSVMRTEISRLHNSIRKTMIYVTHDQVEAMTMSDRIVVMYRGNVQQVGTPQEIYARPANRFVASFVGSPSMNFIEGRTAVVDGKPVFLSSDGAVKLGLCPSAARSGERPSVLGVRPEHITVGSGGISAIVSLVEDLGHEKQLVLRIGDCDVRARAAPSVRLDTGERASVGFDPDALHFFDPSGSRIDFRQD